MKRRIVAALLAAVCVLAGCTPTDITPIADYKTTDEKVISEVLQELRDVTVVSRSLIASTDTRGLTFVTAQGDTCSFWFDERRFEGVGDASYVLSGDEKLWELVWGVRDADPEYQDLMR